MLSEVHSRCRVRGKTELHEWVSTMNENKNPKAGGRQASEEKDKVGLTSTPRQ